jgi:tRNA-dihydrouridine synthase 1
MSPLTTKSLLAYTPMLHSRMFTETAKFRDHHFQPLRNGLTDKPNGSDIYTQSELYLDGNPLFDRPLFVQFCANDPAELLEAASYVAPFCDAVDLNLGCPQGIARKGRYGAFLQEDQELIYSLINTLHTNLSVPVTAKMRILESKEETLKYARKILSAGASILTVHGRHRDQKGHKTGLADWSVIRYLRENLPKETVLFANGNILRTEDIDKCLEETGADAVMSAEGNLYDPAIFGEVPPVGHEGREYWRGRDGKGGYRMDAVFRRYMDILYKYVLEVSPPARKSLFLPSDPPSALETSAEEEGNAKDADEQPPKKKQKRDKKEKTTSPNLLAMQPHLFHLLRSLVSKHHHVRDALARCKAGDIAAFEAVLQMVEAVTRNALAEYEATDGKSIEADFRDPPAAAAAPAVEKDGSNDVALDESSIQTVRVCKRPWWICQPYVRPLPAEALKKGALHLSKKELAKIAAEEEQKRVEGSKASESSEPSGVLKPSTKEVAPLASRSTVGVLGHTELEAVNGGPEAVEAPKEGLVCG